MSKKYLKVVFLIYVNFQDFSIFFYFSIFYKKILILINNKILINIRLPPAIADHQPVWNNLILQIPKMLEYQSLEAVALLFNRIFAGTSMNYNLLEPYLFLLKSFKSLQSEGIARLITFPLLCPNYALKFKSDTDTTELKQHFQVI